VEQGQYQLHPFMLVVTLYFTVLLTRGLWLDVADALHPSVESPPASGARKATRILGQVLCLIGALLVFWSQAYSGNEEAARIGSPLFLIGLILRLGERSTIDRFKEVLRK
jgi:hypothetical protein